jgi:hypothetical protein
MSAVSARVGGESRRFRIKRYSSIPDFTYADGYRLSATDLANRGIKIELSHEHDRSSAIILPPDQVAECGRWMLKTLGQDRHGLPNGLGDVLRRLSRGREPVFERGDKQRIKEALRVLNQ